MPIGRLLFLAFLLIPLLEIYVLIQVGYAIGALTTVVLVVLTALAGAVMIRAQGMATLTRARASLDRGEIPAGELFEGLCLLVAGVALLTPGFVTDALGFLFLIPGIRRSLILALMHAGAVRVVGQPDSATGAGSGPGPKEPGRVIEGEFERKDC